MGEGDVLYESFPVISEAGRELLHHCVAAGYVGRLSVWDGMMVSYDSRLLVEVQKVWDSVFWQFPSGAENKYVLYTAGF